MGFESSSTQRTNIPALTGVRAVAALLVLFHHRLPPLSTTLDPIAQRIGQVTSLGVGMFFVLSGMLITYRYYDSATPWPKYFLNRAARIYPVLFFLTLFVYGGWQSSKPEFWASITLTQGHFNELRYSGMAQVWSITVEETFYVFAPLLFLLIRRRLWPVAIILPPLIGYFLVTFSPHPYGFFANFPFTLLYTYFGRSFEFFVGIMLGLWLLRSPPKMRASKWLTWVGCLGIAAIGFVLYRMPNSPGEYSNAILLPNECDPIMTRAGAALELLVLPLFVAMLYAGLSRERTWLSRWLSGSIMKLLGQSSYVFYLIHAGPIDYWLKSQIGGEFWRTFFVEVFLSIVINRCFEAPVARWVGRWKMGVRLRKATARSDFAF